MEKHKLYKRDESSLQFNSSSENSRCFEKNPSENPKMTSNAGVTKTSTPLRRSLRRPRMQNLVSGKDAASQGTSKVNKQSTVKVNMQSTAKVDKQSIATQADILVPVKQISESDSESESDFCSDSMCVTDFFSGSTQKLPYSYEEDEEILKFILKGQGIFRVSSILIWKDLEQKKTNPKRTYQSLKNRFLRNIKPKLFTTYRHLIPDEETVQKILMKFPELKKDVGKKAALTKIQLPRRIPALKMSPCTSAPEDGTDSESFEVGQFNFSYHMVVPSTSRYKRNELNFHRKVEMSDDSLTVLVNLNFKHPPPKPTRIYEKYLNLKLMNKESRCSACGRSGGPESRPDSGAESDAFISNSFESKVSESLPKKKLYLWKSKSFQSPKRKKKNFVAEPCNDRRSCSPSLLNDVNEVDELGEDTTKDAECRKDTFQSPERSISDASIAERDSTLEEPEVASKDTDSIYQNTVAEFRKLIDSDEEEMLVNKCLRKNSKIIGFNPNMLVEEVHVDSYFIRSYSPDLQSATVSGESLTGSAKSRVKTRSSSATPLAKNMMNMLENTE